MFNKKFYSCRTKRKLGKFYIYFYFEKKWTEYFTDSGNYDRMNFLVASYYIQSMIGIHKTETYLELSQGRT